MCNKTITINKSGYYQITLNHGDVIRCRDNEIIKINEMYKFLTVSYFDNEYLIPLYEKYGFPQLYIIQNCYQEWVLKTGKKSYVAFEQYLKKQLEQK